MLVDKCNFLLKTIDKTKNPYYFCINDLLTMEELKITTNIQVCSYAELVEDDRILVDKAKAMTQNSYVPYSHFHVGAALLLSNGKIVGGSNQENAAFP